MQPHEAFYCLSCTPVGDLPPVPDCLRCYRLDDRLLYLTVLRCAGLLEPARTIEDLIAGLPVAFDPQRPGDVSTVARQLREELLAAGIHC